MGGKFIRRNDEEEVEQGEDERVWKRILLPVFHWIHKLIDRYRLLTVRVSRTSEDGHIYPSTLYFRWVTETLASLGNWKSPLMTSNKSFSIPMMALRVGLIGPWWLFDNYYEYSDIAGKFFVVPFQYQTGTHSWFLSRQTTTRSGAISLAMLRLFAQIPNMKVLVGGSQYGAFQVGLMEMSLICLGKRSLNCWIQVGLSESGVLRRKCR